MWQATQLNNEWRMGIIDKPLFEPSDSVYALIEPELWPKWYAELSQYVHELDAFYLFNSTQFNAIKNGPVVIHLSNSQALLDVCVEKMRSVHCGALFYTASTTSSRELMYALRNALVVRKGSSEVFLRYYEPRALLSLLASMQSISTQW